MQQLLSALTMIVPVARAASTVQFMVPNDIISPGAATYIAVEGFPDVTAVFVRRGGDLGTAVGVEVGSLPGTALPGTDYTEISTNLVFLPGETEKSVLTPVLNDRVAEPLESFEVVLGSPTGGAVLGSPNGVKVRITDNRLGRST